MPRCAPASRRTSGRSVVLVAIAVAVAVARRRAPTWQVRACVIRERLLTFDLSEPSDAIGEKIHAFLGCEGAPVPFPHSNARRASQQERHVSTPSANESARPPEGTPPIPERVEVAINASLLVIGGCADARRPSRATARLGARLMKR